MGRLSPRSAIILLEFIKNNEIAMLANTVEVSRAEAAVEGMKSMENLDEISVQEMHAQLAS